MQTLIEKEIPITKSMAITWSQLTSQNAELSIKLAPNHNHKGTAFGGSIYSCATVACYGLFLSELGSQGIDTNNIVIAHGEIKYLAPVEGDFIIRASWESLDQRGEFLRTLTAKKKARIKLTAQVLHRNAVCAEFYGDFVATL